MTTTAPTHTPGPWHIAQNDFCQWITNSVSKAQIAKAFKPAGMSDDTYNANMQLIASAPDLLKQRDALLAVVQNLESQWPAWCGTPNQVELLKQVRAAIALCEKGNQ